MTAPAGTSGRAAYDPFAPSAGIAFPDRRLLRAGLPPEDLARLASDFRGMPADRQRELVRFVTRNTDRRIVDRFRGARSRQELEGMTVAALEPLLRERHLSTDGRKADLIDRLLTSYEGGREEQPTRAPQTAATPPPGPVTPGEAPEGGSGELAGQTSTPEPQPPAGTDGGNPPAETPETIIGVDTQTPDATPAPDTAPAAEDTTTQEGDAANG
jgi:hypothetical protein